MFKNSQSKKRKHCANIYFTHVYIILIVFTTCSMYFMDRLTVQKSCGSNDAFQYDEPNSSHAFNSSVSCHNYGKEPHYTRAVVRAEITKITHNSRARPIARSLHIGNAAKINNNCSYTVRDRIIIPNAIKATFPVDLRWWKHLQIKHARWRCFRSGGISANTAP